MKKPSFQFYPGDWIIDPGLSTLDYFHIGVFVKLLCFASQAGGELRYREGGKPLTVTDLSNLLGLEGNKTEKTINTLLDHGCLRRREDDGCLYNARMVRDCKEAQEYYEAKKRASDAGHAARWGKMPDAMPNECQTDASGNAKKMPVANVWQCQNDAPSSSSSTSIINTLSNAPAREGEGDPDGSIVPKNMPASPQKAIDMCLGTQVPEDFIVKAYKEAYAVGFKDRGNPIVSWKQYVVNYWEAHLNAKKRREQNRIQPKPPDQYPNDRDDIPSL